MASAKSNNGKSRKYSGKKALLHTVRKPRNGFALSGLVLVFAVDLLWDTVVVSYRADQRGMYWSRLFGGTSSIILDEGTSYKFPWDKIHIYDMRPIAREETTSLLSKEGMKIEVQWSVSFRLDSAKLAYLHRRVGPNYADTVVVPEITAVMRQVLGSYRAAEILTYDKDSLIEQITAGTPMNFSENSIIVQNIVIHKLLSPKGLSQEDGKCASS